MCHVLPQMLLDATFRPTAGLNGPTYDDALLRFSAKWPSLGKDLFYAYFKKEKVTHGQWSLCRRKAEVQTSPRILRKVLHCQSQPKEQRKLQLATSYNVHEDAAVLSQATQRKCWTTLHFPPPKGETGILTPYTPGRRWLTRNRWRSVC